MSMDSLWAGDMSIRELVRFVGQNISELRQAYRDADRTLYRETYFHVKCPGGANAYHVYSGRRATGLENYSTVHGGCGYRHHVSMSMRLDAIWDLMEWMTALYRNAIGAINRDPGNWRLSFQKGDSQTVFYPMPGLVGVKTHTQVSWYEPEHGRGWLEILATLDEKVLAPWLLLGLWGGKDKGWDVPILQEMMKTFKSSTNKGLKAFRFRSPS